jgi:hypothetical protein
MLKSLIITNLNSHIVAQGTPTDALDSCITAICNALVTNHDNWMNATQLSGLKVSGGITFPFAPIGLAIGSEGRLV